MDLAASVQIVERRERRIALAALPPDEFEWLVHALVEVQWRANGIQVRKLRPPDAGADSLVLSATGQVDVAVQAKHYTGRISWRQCEESMTSALSTWDPKEILFVFSRDFTQQEQRSFMVRIDSAAPCRISAWTLTDIERLLDLHPEISTQFLGVAARTVSEALDRARKSGGLRMDSADDLVDRAGDLAQLGSELDPHYVYGHYGGPIEVPIPTWAESPALTLRAERDGVVIEVAAWPRPGHDEKPMLAFTGDETGESARRMARSQLALGQSVVLGAGIELNRDKEPRIKSLLQQNANWQVVLRPGDPCPHRIVVESEDSAFSEEFDLYTVPPNPGFVCAFGGVSNGLRFEVSLLEGSGETGKLWVQLWTNFGHDAALNLSISQRIRTWASRIRAVFEGPIFGDGIEVNTSSPVLLFTKEEFGELEEKMTLFQKTIELEQHFGRRLNFPLVPMKGDVRQLDIAYELLTTGTGTWEQEPITMVVPVEELPEVEEEASHRASQDAEVRVELFGDKLDFGVAEYVRPVMRIAQVDPTSGDPSAPARVTLRPLGVGTFRLKNRERPLHAR